MTEEAKRGQTKKATTTANPWGGMDHWTKVGLWIGRSWRGAIWWLLDNVNCGPLSPWLFGLAIGRRPRRRDANAPSAAARS